MTLKRFEVLKFDGGEVAPIEEPLTVEEPLQISINHTPFTMTMRTPGEDYFLAKGLLWTEGFYQDPKAEMLYSEFRTPSGKFNQSVNFSIPARYLCREVKADRSVISSSSCGLCGKRDASEVRIEGPRLSPTAPLDVDGIPSMQAKMRERQRIFLQTGGSHAAAAFNSEGELLAIFEDIGRHNAVDKVVGSLLEDEAIGKASYLLVSGRVSFEILAKAYAARVPYIAAVSAPSSLAVEFAEKLGMSLVGFCREDRATVYSNFANSPMKV